MILYIEVLNGDLKGTRVRVDDGLIIGRKEGALTIRDSKLSSKHAKVESKPDGTLWLIDLGSSNGIKLAESRVRILKLVPETRFTLGRTQFQVTSTADPNSIVQTPRGAMVETVTRTYWDQLREISEQIATWSKTHQDKRPSLIASFRPILRLKFVKGLQTGTEWTIGYGPRTVGGKSLDLEIEDCSEEDGSFQLIPTPEAARGARLSCDKDVKILLNGRAITSAELKDGDVIDFASSQIKVTFDD